jgi:5,6,7,8-tetrahydromethanopterin hydro-lyase
MRRPLVTGGLFRYEDEELLRLNLEWLGKIRRKTLEFEIKPGVTAKSKFAAIPETPKKISGLALKVGEGFASPSTVNIAHIDVLLGLKSGPVGKTITETLESPRLGHEPQIVKFDGTEVKPLTLLVPTVTVRTHKHANFTYDYAMKGVAKAVIDSVDDGIIPKDLSDDITIIANVFVHPTACNLKRVTINNYKAMRYAIRKALESRPTVAELLERKDSARHPFRYEP